jgi:hypothetical protein
MTNQDSLDIVKDLEDSSDEYENAVFGTYTYEPVFFESKILPILQKRDVENALVLVDQTEYDSNFSKTKAAGKEYYLDFCNCGKIFHPKFALLTWQKGGKLIIGSANLNENEWRTAGEVLISIDYNINKANKDAASAFYEMRLFLQNIVALKLLKSTKHCQKLMQVLTKTEWLANLDDSCLSEKVRLFNNTRQPILNQLFDVIGREKIIGVSIMSPFFGDTALILKEFINRGCKNFQLFVQPQKVIGFTASEIISLQEKGIGIKVFSSEFKENEGRYNHAKIILIKTRGKSFCLFGSPNLTKAALMENATNGNLELAIFRKENDPSYFDYIASSSTFNTKVVDVSKIPLNQITYGDKSKKSLTLNEARLEGKKLTIDFEPCVSDSCTAEITLKQSISEDKKTFSAKTISNSVTSVLDEEKLKFCSNPTSVTLKIKTDKGELVSNPRWISTEYLEISPRRRDIQCIKETNGRIGLINMLNQLSRSSNNQEFLIYCLQWLNFEDLSSSIDSAKRRILQPSNGEEDNQSYLFELEEVDRNEIAKKIVLRHQKKFEKALPTLKDDLPEKLPKTLDLFLFIGKITIWLIQNNSQLVDELRWIWHDSEALVKELKDIHEGNKKLTSDIVKKNLVIEHTVVLGCLVTQMHQLAGYKHSNVMGVFRSAMNMIIETSFNLGYPKNTAEMQPRLNEILKEYKEFTNLKVDENTIFQYYKTLIPLCTNG